MIVLGVLLAIFGAFFSRIVLYIGVALIVVGVILAVGHHPLY